MLNYCYEKIEVQVYYCLRVQQILLHYNTKTLSYIPNSGESKFTGVHSSSGDVDILVKICQIYFQKREKEWNSSANGMTNAFF